MKTLFIIVLIALIVVAAPLLFIWSLNTLFPVLEIPYTIWTWIAALLLGSAIDGSTGK